MGMVEQLMSLLRCEHAPYHEHVMRIIVNLAREHAPSLAECRRPELSFNEFLLQHVVDLRDKPEFQVRDLLRLRSACSSRSFGRREVSICSVTGDPAGSIPADTHLFYHLPFFLLPSSGTQYIDVWVVISPCSRTMWPAIFLLVVTMSWSAPCLITSSSLHLSHGRAIYSESLL